MGDEDEPGLGSETHLFHGPDGHPVVTEDLGHRGQHAGTVGNVDVDVPRAPHVIGGTHAGLDPGHGPGEGAGPQVVGGVDEVA